MMALLRSVFWWLARHATHARYRVRVVGGEKLRGALRADAGHAQPSGLHRPAAGDGPPPAPRRAAAGRGRDDVPHAAALYPLLAVGQRPGGAQPAGSRAGEARQQTLAMIDAIVAGLGRGESFLLYPAGRAAAAGHRGARGRPRRRRNPRPLPAGQRRAGPHAAASGAACSATRRPAVRPRLGRCLLRALGWLAANLLVFAPRRNVTMTVEVIDRRNLPGLGREKLNRYPGRVVQPRRPEPRPSSSPTTACSARGSSSFPAWRPAGTSIPARSSRPRSGPSTS